MPVNQGSCESVRSTIRSNESNTQLTTSNNGGKSINNVPADRGGAGGGHFEGWPGTGTPMGGK